MFKNVEVFDTNKLEKGKPIKLKKRGLSEEWIYGIVQYCSYESLHYLTVEPPKTTPKENVLHLDNALKYGYIVEVLDDQKIYTMNTNDNIYPVFRLDTGTNKLEIKMFYHQSEQDSFVQLNGIDGWRKASGIEVEALR